MFTSFLLNKKVIFYSVFFINIYLGKENVVEKSRICVGQKCLQSQQFSKLYLCVKTKCKISTSFLVSYFI